MRKGTVMRSTAIAIVLLLALVVAGCSSKKEESAPDFDAPDDAGEAERPAPPASPAADVTTETPAEDPVVTRPRMTNEDALVQTPVDYIETVVRLGAYQQYRVKLANVTNAINQYKALKQSYPATVEELVKEGLLVKVPSLKEGHYWKIDQTTGEVTIREKVARPQ